MIVTYISLLSLIVFSTSAEDYCRDELCAQDEQHIGCNNDGSFEYLCPKGAKLLTITEEAQNVAVDVHNEVRQLWASGQGKLKIKACRMATIKWNDELARLAELNVKQCYMDHDCHNTDEFRSSGQNLYTYSTTASVGTVASIISDAVTDWASEASGVNPSDLKAYPLDDYNPVIGHFTVLVNEVNIAVGCAVSQYSEGRYTTVLVACNYAATNIISEPVYEACSKPGSKCSSGTNSKYSALCSLSEHYDVY